MPSRHSKINDAIQKVYDIDGARWIVERRVRDFNVINAVTALKQIVVVGGCPAEEPALTTLADRCSDLLRDSVWEPRSVVTALNSLAHLHVGSVLAGLINELVCVSMTKVAMFKPQDLAMMMWSLATLGFQKRDVMERLCTASVAQPDDFKPQELAMMMWSLATLGIQKPDVMERLCAASMAQLADFKPQDLAMVMWSLAKLGIQKRDVMERLCTASVAQLDDFKEQGLSMMMWSLAKLEISEQFHQPDVTERLGTAVLAQLDSFTAQGLAKMIWSYGKLGIQSPEVMGRLRTASMAQLSDLTPQEFGPWCYTEDALFKMVSGCFFPAPLLEEGSLVRAADGSQVQVVSVEPSPLEDQDMVKLITSSATLEVTQSHRVMVPRGATTQPVPAGYLRPGHAVIISGNREQELLSVEPFTKHAQVYRITFAPDKAVESFHLPVDAIL